MAFDATQPTDTTKIRDLGTVIRPNWVAIEQAQDTFKPYAINLIDRTAAPVSPVDPAPISTSIIAFCKRDSANNPELFLRNENGNITQLTKGNPSIAATGYTFLAGGIIYAWGSQSVINGQEITVSGMSTLYQPVITIDDSSPQPSVRAYTYGITMNKFSIRHTSSQAVVIRWHAIGV